MTFTTANCSNSRSSEIIRLETEIAARIETRLGCSAYRELRLVRCEFHEGVVTLRGVLASYYLKQMAQTVAREAAANCIVVNRIEVAEKCSRPETRHSRPVRGKPRWMYLRKGR